MERGESEVAYLKLINRVGPPLLLQVIATSMNEEEIMGLKELFKSMDTDNSGSITYEELKAGLKRHGTNMPEIQMKQLMESVSVA